MWELKTGATDTRSKSKKPAGGYPKADLTSFTNLCKCFYNLCEISLSTSPLAPTVGGIRNRCSTSTWSWLTELNHVIRTRHPNRTLGTQEEDRFSERYSFISHLRPTTGST